MSETKECNACRESKPLHAFTTDPRLKSGRTAQCKECRRKRAIEMEEIRKQPLTLPEDGEPMTGKQRALRMSIGLELASRNAKPGVPMLLDEIAEFCGCSKERIRQIEEAALKNFRKKLQASGRWDEVKRALVDAYNRKEARMAALL